MQKSIAMFHKMIGPVTSFEYRNQALEFQAGQTDVRDIAHATSAVFYSVITPTFPDGSLFLTVKTQRSATYIEYSSFSFSRIPRRTCRCGCVETADTDQTSEAEELAAVRRYKFILAMSTGERWPSTTTMPVSVT